MKTYNVLASLIPRYKEVGLEFDVYLFSQKRIQIPREIDLQFILAHSFLELPLSLYLLSPSGI